MKKPGSKTIEVILATGMVRVWVLPSDTLNVAKDKIVRIYGRQPDSYAYAKFKEHWVPVKWTATIKEIGKTEYAFHDPNIMSPSVWIWETSLHAQIEENNFPVN